MSEFRTLKTEGAPSIGELRSMGYLPSRDELARRSCVCIECIEEIPCNPCETGCPAGAIVVGSPITNLPIIDRDKCTLCGLCIPVCPGLAVLIKGIEGEGATIRFPWEYLPLPAPGEEVDMVDRTGASLCRGTVTRVSNPRANDNTVVVTATFPAGYVDDIVSMRRKHHEAV